MSKPLLTHPDTRVNGNTNIVDPKPAPRFRAWVFTLNNHSDTEVRDLLAYLRKHTKNKFCIQEEIGEEEKTPHLQGVIHFKHPRTFDSMKKRLPRAHLQPCRDWEASIAYCRKPTFAGAKRWERGIPKPITDPMVGKTLHPYQEKILNLIKKDPDPRKIHWFWEPKGGTGKSVLTKHICMNNNALAVSGKASDIKYAVAQWIAIHGEVDVVIIDLPRTNERYVSYQAMEEIKNGLFFTTKYESGMTIFNPPHLIVFANFEPDTDSLSKDRWDVNLVL